MKEYDAIVVGAGPAGLTAAIYLARANMKTLVLEKQMYGGQILKASIIENYPGVPKISGAEYSTNLFNQAKDLGVDVKFETVTKVNEDKTVVTNVDTYAAKAVILATGVTNKLLEVEGAGKYMGKGVSYCATCDGNFFKNKTVAVLGGGNTAFEEALYLSGICEKVYIIHRRDTFKGSNHMKEMLDQKDNVEYIMNSTINKVIGDDTVKSIEVINNDGIVKVIQVSCVFVAIGQIPNNSAFSNVADLDEYGYFVRDSLKPYTKTPGIYVAGDAIGKRIRQLTTAVADGTVAAMAALLDMRGEQ
jgi:thioredoxin reductase (NADPH)